MLNNKLIHIKQKKVFEEKLNSGEILDGNIVFIQDTQEIWTHGQLYFCEYLAGRVKGLEDGLKSLGDLSGESVQNLQLAITDLDGKKIDKSLAEEIHTELDERLQSIENLIDTDSDAVIDKWEEVVDFLNNIGAENDLEALLAAKANVTSLDETNRKVTSLVNADKEIRSEISTIETDLSGKITQAESSFVQTADEILQEVSRVETTLDSKVQENKASISTTADAIRSEVSATKTDLQGQIDIANSSITQTANNIQSQVTQVKQDLETGLEQTSSKIDQKAGEIALQVESVQQDLQGQINTNKASITTTAEGIRQEVSATIQGLDGRLTTAEANITVNANRITSEVSRIDGDLEEASTRITQTADKLQTVATTVDGHTSSLTQTAKSIEMLVENDEEINGVLTSHDSRITQTSKDITAAVTRITDVETSTANLKIQANSIEQSITSTKEDLEGQITTVENTTKSYADKIETRLSETINGVEGRVTTVETDLDGITQRVEKTEEGVAGAATKTYATQIEQKADGIQLTVNSQTKQINNLNTKTGNLETRVSTAETSIEQLSDSIELKVATSDFESLRNAVTGNSNRITQNEADIKIAKDSISSKVSQTDFNTLNSKVNGQAAIIENHATEIVQTKNAIEQKVSNSTFDAYKGTVSSEFTTVKNDVKGVTTRIGSAEGNITSMQQDITGLTASLGTTNANIESLQKQADGAIDTFFGEVDPTLSNEPASNWTTVSLKREHSGDLYYNNASGAAWRYTFDGTNASWTRITDEALSKALQSIETLTGKIDGKISVFYTKPTSYKYGDIWFADKDYATSTTGLSFNIKENSLLVASGLANSTTSFKWTHWSLKGDVKTKLSEFADDVSNAWADGVLTDAEKLMLEESKKGLQTAYDELCASYNVLITTSVGKNSSELATVKTAKTNLDGKYSTLITAINAAINEPNNSNISNYNTAYTNYSSSLVSYDTAVANLTEANQVSLSKATDYIKDIASDGKLTPIEKKQLFNIWKGIAEEFDANKGIAVNYKIIKSDGTKRSDIYSGDTYYTIYQNYATAYTALSNIFTNTNWKWNDFENTTTIPSGNTLSGLDTKFETYYDCLNTFSKMISEISIKITDSHQQAKDYVDWVQNHLKPEDNITVVGKGVVLSTIMGVKSSNDNSFVSALNASDSHKDSSIYNHGRIVFAGGINDSDWNKSTTVIYEDGHVKFNSGEVGSEFKLGDAVLTSDVGTGASTLNVAKVTINGKQVPLFTVSTDANGNILKISTVYDFQTNKNLIVRGDISSGGTSSSGGGSVVSLLTDWSNYSASTHSKYAISAPLGHDLYTRIGLLENGSATNFTNSGSGNVVTSITKDGANVTVTKGITALTSHQNIYSLIIKNSAGTTQTTYTPNSSSASITLTKAMVGLGSVTNLAASDYFTDLSSNTTNAISITVGGTTKTITPATMKTSLGLGSLAYKNNLSKSDVGLGNVENKSSSTIRGEITSANVTTALGYTPYNVANFTKANIKSTLGISDWALASAKPSYKTSEVTEKTNLYFTNARAISACSGTYLSLTNGGIIKGPVTISSTLNVENNAVFNGDVRINGNLVITGDIASGETSTGTSSGSLVTFTPAYSSGLTLGNITIDGITSGIYAPKATASSLGLVKVSAVRTNTITATTGGTTSGRYYGVESDSNGKMFVNVPWTDTVSGGSGGTSAYPHLLSSVNGKSYPVSNGDVIFSTSSFATALDFRKVVPTSDACVIYIVKSVSVSLSIPVVATSGIRMVNQTSLAAATSTLACAGVAGLMLIWDAQNAIWTGYILK